MASVSFMAVEKDAFSEATVVFFGESRVLPTCPLARIFVLTFLRSIDSLSLASLPSASASSSASLMIEPSLNESSSTPAATEPSSSSPSSSILLLLVIWFFRRGATILNNGEDV